MNKSRLRNLENDPISMHCKRDNLNPSPFYHSKNPSSYQLNYSPEKEAYKNPQIGKQFQYHRKQEDRASMYNLPNILENTNYQQSFHPQPLEKIMRGKQKDSWFLKMGWALEPTSHYRVISVLFRKIFYRRMVQTITNSTSRGLITIIWQYLI